MGGHAFSNLGEDAFPRMPTNVYEALKSDIHEKLSRIFELVGTPRERPNKLDHGDIDFIVYNYKKEQFSPEAVQVAIGAEHLSKSVAANAFGTSNYALVSSEKGKYYQVDVNVCTDKDEWERIMFFHSFGDLGMIIGLMARAYGLSLGTKGLKVISPKTSPDSAPLPSLHLSSDFTRILPFFKLSYSEWEAGFADTQSIFAWVEGSPFFSPQRFARAEPSGCRRDKLRKSRTMYQEFIEFAREAAEQGQGMTEKHRRKRDSAAVLQEALDYFGKRDEFDAMVFNHGRRQRIKAKFSGTKVIQWTGLENNGAAVGEIVRIMKTKFTDDEILIVEEDALKQAVLQLQQDLGLSLAQVTFADPGMIIAAEETAPVILDLASTATMAEKIHEARMLAENP